MKIVCFLPGILGSELRTATGLVAWPPTVKEAALGRLDQEKVEALLDENAPLEPTEVIGKVCLRRIYSGILSTIQDAGFGRFGNKQLRPVPYDWRLDIVDEIAPSIAAQLDAWVDEGATEFRFVAHSMGGLVARVLLQDDRYVGRAWRAATKQLITIATPFKGAPKAVYRLLGKESMSGIPADAFGQLRKKTKLTGPSQLMPNGSTPIVWTIEGETISIEDFYGEGGFGEQSGFERAVLDSVGRLHTVLDKAWPVHVSQFQFAGTGMSTMTRLASHGSVIGLNDDNSGDETVPLTSASGTAAPTMILHGEHLDLVNNSKLKRTLQALLGASDDLVVFAADEDGSAMEDEEQGLQVSVPVLGVTRKNGRASFETLLTMNKPVEQDTDVQVTIQMLDENGNTIAPEDANAAQSPAPLTFDVRMSAGMSHLALPVNEALEPGFYAVSTLMIGKKSDETILLVLDPAGARE